MPENNPPEIERLYTGPDYCAAFHANVFVLIAREEPTAGLLERQKEWLERLDPIEASRAGFMIVLRAEAPPPSESARVVIHRFYSEFSGRIAAGAMVIEGEGFRAAAVRSATSLIVLAARYPYPIKAFGSIRDGARWLQEKLAADPDRPHAGLAGAVQALRESYSNER